MRCATQSSNDPNHLLKLGVLLHTLLEDVLELGLPLVVLDRHLRLNGAQSEVIGAI